jgi:hypothetical protein
VIVALCPAGEETGGPEALHQLVSTANEISPGSASICYLPADDLRPVPGTYAKYNAPVVRRDAIPNDALVIVPEIWTGLISEFEQPCAVWWLSLDWFFQNSGKLEDARRAVAHFAQSEYARAHLSSRFNITATMLSDYISESFAVPVAGPVGGLIRIVVSPPVGNRFELLKRRAYIRKIRRNFTGTEVLELGGMSRDRLKAALAGATAFVDMGTHPGKGRMPREAALLGAVVLISRRGSAMNSIDAPIDDWYKFDSPSEIVPKLEAIISDVQKFRVAQDGYRGSIRAEREIFTQEVSKVLELAYSLA